MKVQVNRLLIVVLFALLLVLSTVCLHDASANRADTEESRSKIPVSALPAIFLYHNITSVPTVVSGEYLDVWGVLVEDGGTTGVLDNEAMDLRLADRTIKIYWDGTPLVDVQTGADGIFTFSTGVNKDVGVYVLIAEFVPTALDPPDYITARDYRNITVKQRVTISAVLNTTTVIVGENILLRNGEIRVNSTSANYTLGMLPITIRLDEYGEVLRTLNVTNGVFSSEVTIPNGTSPYTHTITITTPETTYYAGATYTLQTPIVVSRKTFVNVASKIAFRGNVVIINGTLVDNTNAPVVFDTTNKLSEGLRIEFGGSEIGVIRKSGSNGGFTFNYSVNLSHPVGNVSVVVSFTGTSTSPYYVGTSSATVFTVKAYTKFLLGEASGFSDVLVRGRTTYVSGKLYDIGNPSEPLPNKSVFIKIGDGADQEGKTNVRGEFSVFCNIEKGQQLGRVNVTVTYYGEYLYIGNTSVFPFFIISEAVIKLDALDKVIKGEDVTVSGKIEDDSGEPISYGLINLYWMQNGKQQLNRELDTDGIKYLPLSANADGSFTLRFEAYELGGEVISGGEANITAEFVGIYVYTYKDNRTNETTYTYDALTDSNKTLIEKKNYTFEDRKSGLYVPYTQGSKTINCTVFTNTIFEITNCPTEVVRDLGAVSFNVDGRLLEYYGSKHKTTPITPVKSQIVKGFFWDIYRTNLTNQNGSFSISLLSIISESALGNTTLSIAYNGSSTDYLLPTTISRNITVKSKTKLTLIGLPTGIIKGEEFGGTALLTDDKLAPLNNKTVTIVFEENDTIIGNTNNNGNFIFKKKFIRDPKQDEKIVIRVLFDEGDAPLYVSTNTSIAIPYGVQSIRPPEIAPYIIGTCIGIIIILFYVSHWRKKHQLQEMQRIIKRITKQLIAGNEYIATIFKAYRKFETLLKRHGQLRQEWETFREFEKALKQTIPINAEELGRLLTILEEARYSEHEIGEDQRNATIDCLQRIEADISRYLQSDDYRKKMLEEEKVRLEAKRRERAKIFKKITKIGKKPTAEEVEVEDVEILIDKKTK
ncbi:MAG: DUF4129 domain-containing protein [Thermoplasmata archaeon]